MIDIFLILIPLFLFIAGNRYKFICLLLALNLILSSVFSLVVPTFYTIESLDPGLFYYNFILPVSLCFISCYKVCKYTLHAGITFILTGLISFLTYIEIYFSFNAFYNLYSEAMLFLSGWQIYLLFKAGNVKNNVRDCFISFAAGIFWRNFHMSNNLLVNKIPQVQQEHKK